MLQEPGAEAEGMLESNMRRNWKRKDACCAVYFWGLECTGTCSRGAGLALRGRRLWLVYRVSVPFGPDSTRLLSQSAG